MSIKQKEALNILNVVLISLLILPYIFLSAAITYGAPLNWCTSKTKASSIAKSQGKFILLIAGRDTCSKTNHMRIICETDTALHTLIEKHFVPWYCDSDASKEWYVYAKDISGYNGFVGRSCLFQYDATGSVAEAAG